MVEFGGSDPCFEGWHAGVANHEDALGVNVEGPTGGERREGLAGQGEISSSWLHRP